MVGEWILFMGMANPLLRYDCLPANSEDVWVASCIGKKRILLFLHFDFFYFDWGGTFLPVCWPLVFPFLFMGFSHFSIYCPFPYWLYELTSHRYWKSFFLVYLPLDFKILYFYGAIFLKSFPSWLLYSVSHLPQSKNIFFKSCIKHFLLVILWFPFYI